MISSLGGLTLSAFARDARSLQVAESQIEVRCAIVFPNSIYYMWVLLLCDGFVAEGSSFLPELFEWYYF